PWDPIRLKEGSETIVHLQNQPYCIARLIAFSRVASLHKIPDIAFLWASGKDKAEPERQRYIHFYQKHLNLETIEFALYVFQRLQFL
ncbi:MAG: hypothetical protein AAGJ35_15775, partial [Myxococcota bacterium]